MARAEQREAIRRIFAEGGGQMHTRRLAKAVMEGGVYSEEDLVRIHFRAVQTDCRKALNEPGHNGLPFAQPVAADPEDDDESEEARLPLWQQLDLFTYDETADLIARRCRGIECDYAKARAIWNYCNERFGKAPEMPELVTPVAV